MIIVSSKEFKQKQRKYFDLAQKEQVMIKRKNNYVNLVVTKKPDNNFITQEWLDEYFAIPEAYRCNPFDISPSGDLFWADKRNVEHVEKAVKKSEQQVKEGKYTVLKTIKTSINS